MFSRLLRAHSILKPKIESPLMLYCHLVALLGKDLVYSIRLQQEAYALITMWSRSHTSSDVLSAPWGCPLSPVGVFSQPRGGVLSARGPGPLVVVSLPWLEEALRGPVVSEGGCRVFVEHLEPAAPRPTVSLFRRGASPPATIGEGCYERLLITNRLFIERGWASFRPPGT